MNVKGKGSMEYRHAVDKDIRRKRAANRKKKLRKRGQEKLTWR